MYLCMYEKLKRKSGDSNIFESPTDSLNNIWITNDSLKNIQTKKEHQWVVVQNLHKSEKERLFGDEQKWLKTTN